MRYIRTKDGIYDLKLKPKYENDKETIEWFINHYYGGMNNFVKGADTIEELCDEFIRVNKDFHDFLVSDDIPTQIKGWDIYGAIWTDWGLKYIAKMNESGCLQLL